MMEIVKKPEHKKYLALFEKIDKLIQEELEKAKAEHGEFASSHEGISVLLEEIEEAEFVQKSMKKLYGEAWEGVKADDFNGQLPNISKLYLKSLYLIMESIQVAAMAEKYYKYLQANNPQGSIPGQASLMDVAAEATKN
jgi:hypothetical protein